MLWLGCAGITMMFAAWTSAYLVRHAAGNWLEFKIPQIFFLLTLLSVFRILSLQCLFGLSADRFGLGAKRALG